LSEKTKTATVLVPVDQLSLAIGREGQNVRLAAQLTNWRLDLKGKEVKTDEVAELEKVEAKEAATPEAKPTADATSPAPTVAASATPPTAPSVKTEPETKTEAKTEVTEDSATKQPEVTVNPTQDKQV
ncbi:MAG: NusA antitermination factor, partial [Candidatus Gottesmanbacteria bacterium GW2011_GWC1_43_10]